MSGATEAGALGPRLRRQYRVQIALQCGDREVTLTSEPFFGATVVVPVARSLAHSGIGGEAFILGPNGEGLAWVYADGRAPTVVGPDGGLALALTAHHAAQVAEAAVHDPAGRS